MARIGPDHIDAVLDAAKAWRERCFEDDGSLFGEEKLWTLDNVQELKHHFLGDQIKTRDEFFNRLEEQLKVASPQVKRLAAEAVWFLFLYLREKPEMKRNYIQRVWEWSGSSLPDSDHLNDRVLMGIGPPDPGPIYKIFYRELEFLLRMLERWKSEPQKSKLITEDTPWKFVAWIDEIDNSEWRQVRHAILYFLFPDHLERSVSFIHKRWIVEAFQDRLPEELNNIVANDEHSYADRDRAIYELRKSLEKERGEKIDFYHPSLKKLWWQNPQEPERQQPDMPDESLENPDNRLVKERAQVIENIWRYQTELDKGSDSANYLVERMRDTRHWYAVELDGRWLFAPSKFIGYVDNNTEDYKSTGRDGRKTEKRLKQWSDEDVDDKLRPALLQFYGQHGHSILKRGAEIHVLKRHEPSHVSLNTILYGPPGTGKTYRHRRRCVEICDGLEEWSDKYIRERYKELVDKGRVEFVTFHQSYGYEEFVEGLRPETGSDEDTESGAGFRLEPVDGVLKRISERARKTSGRTDASFDLAERQIFKMGLGIPRIENHIFDECITNNYVLLGWGGEIDWSDRCYDNIDNILARWQEEYPESKTQAINIQSIKSFRNRMRKGDIVIVPASGERFRAVGEVTGDYEFYKRDEGNYPHRRSVHWHWHDEKGMPVSDIYDGVLTPRTIYQLSQKRIKTERLTRYTSPVADSSHRLPHVLVIDEINRANVSKVLGELVTLLEEDKREGAPNEVPVTLPYSEESFTLPANLHILGTMNTADRSIALLDTALRRRFEFEELLPRPELLKEVKVDGIDDLPDVLRVINKRLEWLLDRDHLIGHAWFMGAENREAVDRVMRHKIIPLIAEYFHDDWNKVRAVLGGTDDFVRREPLDPLPGFDDDTDEKRYSWRVQGSFEAGAYNRLISGKPPDEEAKG